jgi:hypothetical protein
VGIGWINHQNENDISMVSFDAGGSWKITEKVSLNLDANNGIEPATQNLNNYNKTTRSDVSLKWNLVREIEAVASVRYLRNDFDQLVENNGAMKKKSDDTYTGSIKICYRPPAEFADFFFETKYDDKSATFEDNEYKQFVATIGVNIKL